MKWIQERIEQPCKDDVLIRYMDKWFDNFVTEGLSFAALTDQKDKIDGIAFTESGLKRMINNGDVTEGALSYRKLNYISCWKIQRKVKKKDFKEYCTSTEKNIGYAVMVYYKDLIKHVDSNCKIVNGNKYFQGYFVNWGKIKYCKLKKCNLPKAEFIELETYYKGKKDYKHENEFRIKLTIASAKFIPKNGNYLIENNGWIKIIKMYSLEWAEFLKRHCRVFEYNKDTKRIKETTPDKYLN